MDLTVILILDNFLQIWQDLGSIVCLCVSLVYILLKIIFQLTWYTYTFIQPQV